MAIDPNADYMQAEAILNGQMDERAATPAARALALRRMNMPLRYPNKPDSMGGARRPRGATPVGPASLSSGMAGAPSTPISTDEAMANEDIQDMETQIQGLRTTGTTPDGPNDPTLGAQDRIYNRKVNPYKTPDDAATDRSIAERRKNRGEYDLGVITDQDRADERSWQQFANASPGSQTQATYDPRAYAEYENRVRENLRAANARERFARQQELDSRTPEEHQAILDNANTKNKRRQEIRRNVEVAARTGNSEIPVDSMTPAEKRESAMLFARASEARGREESYRRQVRLGGGTVSGRTARADEVLQGMTPDARSRTLAQIMGGGAMGANDVEAQQGANLIRGLLSGNMGQGGAANGPLAQAQAEGANQQNAQTAQDLRRKDEDQIIGDRFAPPRSILQGGGHNAFTLDEQNQAVADLRARGYTEQQAQDAVRRIKNERTGIWGQPGI